MGLRYLFLGLAIWAALSILRHLFRNSRSRQGTHNPAKSVDSVQCAFCGLHLPRNEAIQRNGEFFCSEEHHLAHHKGPEH